MLLITINLMSLENLESRITELEIKISFQDSLVSTLNSVVKTQQDQITKLTNEISLLKGQMIAEGGVEKDFSKPPHY